MLTAVDGSWSIWGIWSSCSRTCGAGVKRRDRDCDDPQPQNGGDDCSGSDEQTQFCEESQCAGITKNTFYFFWIGGGGERS